MVRLPHENTELRAQGLKQLYANANASARGVPPDTVDKLRKMFAFLDVMQAPGGTAGTYKLEGSHLDRRPQGDVEPSRNAQPPAYLPYRHG
jgi:hypothetical protein